MTETLYIRLPSQASQTVHWLIWAEQAKEIIASGELANVEELTELSEKAQTRKVIVFVPASDVSLKALQVPGNSQRAIRMAAPYMLEDDLAQDVEQLFFAYATVKNSEQAANCYIAIVAHQQMQQWLSWLANANIIAEQMLPDALALPLLADNTWTSIKIGNDLIIRSSLWQTIAIDADNWNLYEKLLASKVSQTEEQEQEQTQGKGAEQPIIAHYSPLSCQHFNCQAMPEELPLALLATHVKEQKFNLLQEQYQIKQARSPLMSTWLPAIVLAAIALVFTLSFKFIELHKVNNEIAEVEAQIVKRYKQAFPRSKRVKVSTVRSQLKRELAKLGNSTNQANLLAMFEKIRPAFVAVPQLKPDALKFDAKRQELRIQATAAGYQYFEKFKTELEKAQLTVKQGSLNNEGEQVSGSFSVKGL